MKKKNLTCLISIQNMVFCFYSFIVTEESVIDLRFPVLYNNLQISLYKIEHEKS